MDGGDKANFTWHGFFLVGHLLEDEGMLGAAGVGCVLLFQTYTWFSCHPMYLPPFIFLL